MRDLPTGTVTFLFTDIEGSTGLLQDLGRDEFVRLLDRHAEILRTAVAEQGGVEIGTEGDSFFVAFPTASGALRAAVAAQRALAAHPWSDGNPIRVRMGLHTGEGVPGGDNYVGIDVNRAARIAAAGHGGQIVISEATRVLVAGDVPDGVTFRDLGLHDLKGLEHPERLHDLVIDGLSADFPALRTRGAQRTNLRPRRTSFVGRTRAMDDIERLLRETRLLTLTGPGGTGKTRLALEIASRQLDRFPDGVFFVDLSPLTDPTLVISEIAGVLKVREAPDLDLAGSLRRHLADLDVMLVLDNFEQLVDGSSAIGDLLDAAPGLTVLATSRIALRLSGEHEYQVAPLELPARERRGDAAQLVASESVRLFVDRATSVRPDFTLTDANASAVAEIVERLDGLPLALELAASRLRVLDPTTLAERLEHRLSMLRGGDRDLPERHRTLDGTIRWSYEMLEPDEQRLFARLSVFAGGWTLDAAEARLRRRRYRRARGTRHARRRQPREAPRAGRRDAAVLHARDHPGVRLGAPRGGGRSPDTARAARSTLRVPRRARQRRARGPARQLAGALGRGAGESPSRPVMVPRPIRLRGLAGDRRLARPLLDGPGSPQ